MSHIIRPAHNTADQSVVIPASVRNGWLAQSKGRIVATTVQRGVFFLEPLDFYFAAAQERFTEAGWRGDCEIGLLWLPPFAFPLALRVPSAGIVVWHVKQQENGVSFLLAPIKLPFEESQS